MKWKFSNGKTYLDSIETLKYITMPNTGSLCLAELCMTKSNILSVFCMMYRVLMLEENNV